MRDLQEKYNLDNTYHVSGQSMELNTMPNAYNILLRLKKSTENLTKRNIENVENLK